MQGNVGTGGMGSVKFTEFPWREVGRGGLTFADSGKCIPCKEICTTYEGHCDISVQYDGMLKQKITCTNTLQSKLTAENYSTLV